MARPLRIEIADGIYHVTSRGIERRSIARDDVDRGRWTDLLGKMATRRRWRVYAWALMSNHFHLFFRAPDGDVSAGLHDLNSAYVTSFNRRHGRSGPLFQGRFKGILIDDEFHRWELNRYIDLNPVRAGIVADPARYRWGSCQYYFGGRHRLDWLASDEILREHGRTLRAARLAYRDYVLGGVASPPESPFRGIVAGTMLGSMKFVLAMRARLAESLPDREVPAAKALRAALSLSEIAKTTSGVYGVAVDEIRRKGRHQLEARNAAICLSRRLTGRTLAEIGAYFGGIKEAAVSVVAKRVRDRAAQDAGLARSLRRIETRLAGEE